MERTYSFVHNSDELKKIIFENPDLPIVVLAGEEASSYGFYWTYCSSVSCHISEILDCDYYDYDDTVFTDRDRLEEKITDDLYDDYHMNAEEWDNAVKRKLEELEPYWKKVIAIYATN